MRDNSPQKVVWLRSTYHWELFVGQYNRCDSLGHIDHKIAFYLRLRCVDIWCNVCIRCTAKHIHWHVSPFSMAFLYNWDELKVRQRWAFLVWITLQERLRIWVWGNLDYLPSRWHIEHRTNISGLLLRLQRSRPLQILHLPLSFLFTGFGLAVVTVAAAASGVSLTTGNMGFFASSSSSSSSSDDESLELLIEDCKRNGETKNGWVSDFLLCIAEMICCLLTSESDVLLSLDESLSLSSSLSLSLSLFIWWLLL